MAVVTFTSNASTGAGSLSEAVKNASPGDVIRPDETVFERGSTIEIVLASTLSVGKNLTLDGGPFRVRLNGGGARRCASVAANVTATFIGVDFVAGYYPGVGGGINAPGTTDVTFERCGFYGCKSNLGGGAYTTGTTRYNNCAFLGCVATESGGAVYARKETTLNGVTAAGCVAANKGDSLLIVDGTAAAINSILCGSVGNPQFLTATGSVVGVASSSVGFVVSPPDDLSVENWDANAWRSWNLRLLDDASGAPSPYRDSGEVDAMSRYDLDGNFRGRETNGATSCSPGAYETLQADLFWIGVEIDPTAPSDLKVADYDAEAKTLILSWTPNLADATGYDVQYSMSGTGWANLTDAAADATSRLCGGLSAARTYIYRIRAYNAVGATAWSTIAFTPSALDEATAETGTREVVSPSLLASNGWAASRFARRPGDAAPQLGQTLFVDGRVHFIDALLTSSTQTFGLTVGGGAVVAIDAASRVYLGELQIALGASFTSTSTAQARTSTRCGVWSRINSQFDAATPCDFDVNSYLAYAVFYTAYIPNAATYGSLKVATAANDMIRLSGEYVCDVFSTAQNGTATDQTIRVGDDGATIRARQFRFGGDGASNYVESFFDRPVTLKLQGVASVSLPSTRRESWADDFLIDVTDATSATLTLSGQTVCGDAPNAAVELSGSAKIDEHGLDVASLTLAAGATLAVDGGKVCVAELTVADGATVAFSPVATNGTAGTDAIYVDAILSATTAATVGAATFTGVGYFATPQGTDASAATFAEDVRACDYGAGISAFSAVAISPTEAAIEWSATDETATLCVERKTSSGWEVVDVRGESGLTAAIATPGATVFRAFDGAAFWSDSAWFLTGEQFTVETDFFAVAEDGAESVEYETETHIVTTNIDKSICWGQSLTFLARIRNAFTGDLLLNDGTRTKGVRYSLYRREGSLFSTSEDDVPVRLDVDAGAACLLETAQTSDAWPGVEYNFALIPANSADEPLIPAPGNYVLRVFVELTTGNPIVFVYTFAAR